MDQEYIDELKKLGTQNPDEVYTSVGDHDETIQLVRQDESARALAEQKKRARTYANSELPVRPCTSTCPKRGTCRDFLTGRVQDHDLCKPELRRIKKTQSAFRKGDVDVIKTDVGATIGSLLVLVDRLIEIAIRDGLTIEVEKFSASGDAYTELLTHPAIKEATNILKTLGITLAEYLMTSKSQKDAGPQVQVNVGISMAELNNRFAKRFAGEERPDDS